MDRLASYLGRLLGPLRVGMNRISAAVERGELETVTYTNWCTPTTIRLRKDGPAGTYAIYVVLTSVFYFVGLAYDNVSQVTLFILFMGLIESAWFAATRLARPAVA